MRHFDIPFEKLAKEDDLIAIGRAHLDQLTKENLELRAAIQAILSGELALGKGKTRPFREFLKSEFSQYSKGFKSHRFLANNEVIYYDIDTHDIYK